MKFKPIHIILVIVLLIESIVLGVTLAHRITPTDITTKDCVAIPVTYEANEDATYQVLSLFDKHEVPAFTFADDTNTYNFTGDAAQFINYYQNEELFNAAYPDASPEAWTAYKSAVMQAARDATNTEHTQLQYVKKVANGWYGTPTNIMVDNLGYYTLNMSTTIASWATAFDGILPMSNGTQINELALPAIVRVGDDGEEYNAMIMMVINDDGNTANNASANEVHINVYFGAKLMKDFHNQPIHIYTMNGEGTQYLSYMKINASFTAQVMETRYRDILH